MDQVARPVTSLRHATGLPLAVLLAFLMLLTLEASPAAAASSKACRVRNTSTGQTYKRLQQAVKAAKPGARLVVKGTCHGGTFIDKSLAIVGTTTERSGKAVLDGDGKARVLTIKPGIAVNIRNLTVRDGAASVERDSMGRPLPKTGGDGIVNRGKVTLRDVVLTKNGAGAYEGTGTIINEGRMRLLGHSIVRANYGGVANQGRLVLADDTRIRDNMGGVSNAGVLVMNDASSIKGNFEGGHAGAGVQNDGSLTMNGTSSILDHRIDGGVRNNGALVMNDASSIHDNWSGTTYLGPGGAGGGAGAFNRGTLVMNEQSSIHHNVAIYSGSSPGKGAGVYNMPGATLTMTGSATLHDNEAQSVPPGLAGLGGGVYNANGGILNGVNCAPQTLANVYGNSPDDCYFESP